jgi:hypothetical protein
MILTEEFIVYSHGHRYNSTWHASNICMSKHGIIDMKVVNMDNFNLEPKYTSNEVPGRCLKCLAEKELNNCLFGLLGEKTTDEELHQRYEALLALLESPDFEKLRSRAEKILSDGKQVKIRVNYDNGNLKCELISE